MIHRPLKPLCLALLAAVPALMFAQAETSAREDERLTALTRADGMWFSPRSKLSVGFRVLNSGGRVDFGNLGTVPALNPIIPASEGAKTRSYTNGEVRLDGPRTDEIDADGNQTSTPGGRYDVYGNITVNTVDGDGNITDTQTVNALTGNFLSYTPGLTREYTVGTSEQLTDTPGYVRLSNYSTISDGATLSKEQGATAGVELQFSREFGRGSRHLKWGIAAGVALNDINSKTSGSVLASLRTQSDFYSLNGQTAPANQLSNPYADNTVDLNGDGFLDINELTVPISTTPAMSTDTTVVGGATVAGRWEVKGAYFMIKVGPTLHTQLTDSLGITASLGLAGAYAGTRYSATESFTPDQLPGSVTETQDPETGASTISSTASKFLTGYYADLNLEWAANERFGLFGGVTAQQLDSYDQKLGDRTAKIDLGSAVGVRGGVSIKF